jgi:hypothetical protein
VRLSLLWQPRTTTIGAPDIPEPFLFADAVFFGGVEVTVSAKLECLETARAVACCAAFKLRCN